MSIADLTTTIFIILKICSPKNIAFLTVQKMDHKIGFTEKPQCFRRKLAKVAENSDLQLNCKILQQYQNLNNNNKTTNTTPTTRRRH
jgi:hypothetical protein